MLVKLKFGIYGCPKEAQMYLDETLLVMEDVRGTLRDKGIVFDIVSSECLFDEINRHEEDGEYDEDGFPIDWTYFYSIAFNTNSSSDEFAKAMDEALMGNGCWLEGEIS